MGNTIHILNGDSTAEIFASSGLRGNVAVWRELLCEGPLDKAVGSDEFWKKRYFYFNSELGIDKLEYFDKTIKELLKFEDLDSVDEVVLWFEFDLFCQVNMIAICAYLLKNFRKNVNYYLVCTGETNEQQQLKSLSEYTASSYIDLYYKKVKLSRSNLQYAAQCWELFVENDREQLKAFNFNLCTKFNYLQKAILQHLERFSKKNGLNQIENKLLNIIQLKPKTLKEIVGEILIWQGESTVYGFGDLQYMLYIKKLHKFYTIKNSMYYLNEKGLKMINDGNK